MYSIQGPGKISEKAALEQRPSAKNGLPDKPTGRTIPRGEGEGVELISLDKRNIRNSGLGFSAVGSKGRDDKLKLQAFASRIKAVNGLVELEFNHKKLGNGKGGEVFEYVDKEQNKKAVKCNDKYYSDVFKVDLDRGEVLLLNRLEHPNIMTIDSVLIGSMDDEKMYGVIIRPEQLPEDRKRLYISCVVSERVWGKTLSQYMSCVKIDKKKIVDIFLQLAKGVNFLHSLGCAHRDISAINVMYDPETGLLKLIDFGTVKGALARTGSYVGALQLLSEDCTSLEGGGYDPVALDLSEMGAVMLFCLTGKYVSSFRAESNKFTDLNRVEIANVDRMKESANAFAQKEDVDKKRIIKSHLKKSLQEINPECLDIVIELLDSDPLHRPSAQKVMERLKSIQLADV